MSAVNDAYRQRFIDKYVVGDGKLNDQSAVIYTRVSTPSQAFDGASLSWQLDACLDLCKLKKLRVEAAFSDIGSGDAIEEARLPGRRNAVRMCMEKGCLLVCWDLSRFSRECLQHHPYFFMLEFKRALFVTEEKFPGGLEKLLDYLKT